ncbi:dTMP kinase [Clostridium chromiireducens]|uniref:Thymidylate kinase n=1 Tax=Clostridium chromiireducens TaxID=225345 RepID=A0A964RQD3_9CLOT|nr:dTMP kinase [Clostridium chromiireducens]MVX65795.1 dTMP kinase [Clostridium chromiireducens]
MLKNTMLGILIAVDGPNGAGKTTIIKELHNRLNSTGYKLEITKEPSYSKLGQFLRKESEKLSGNALACLVAADRYQHLINEIIPALQEGKIVLCDRYVLSSFIFQGMDGVEYKFINDLNSKIIAPDIQIVLYASIYEIQNRLRQRNSLTRFEKNNQTRAEIQCLNKGIEHLEKENIHIYKFNTEDDIKKNVDIIYNVIVSYIKKAGD